MCGRYVFRCPFRVAIDKIFGPLVPMVKVEFDKPRYNIAKTQAVPAIRLGDDGKPEAVALEWGFLPRWERDPEHAPRPVNAKAETIATKPMFRDAFKNRRCLVLADGFIEWRGETGSDGKAYRQPYFFWRPGDEPFAFAGVWEKCGEVESMAFATTTPTDISRPYHDRSPILLTDRREAAKWLYGSGDDLLGLLKPYEGPLSVRPLSTLINSPRNEGPELLAEV